MRTKQKKALSLIGAAWNLGQPKLGVEKAPKEFRQANFIKKIEDLGYEIDDKNDLEFSDVNKSENIG